MVCSAWLCYLQAHYRKMNETTGSLIERLLPKSIHTVTALGFELKIVLFVVACSFNQLWLQGRNLGYLLLDIRYFCQISLLLKQADCFAFWNASTELALSTRDSSQFEFRRKFPWNRWHVFGFDIMNSTDYYAKVRLSKYPTLQGRLVEQTQTCVYSTYASITLTSASHHPCDLFFYARFTGFRSTRNIYNIFCK